MKNISLSLLAALSLSVLAISSTAHAQTPDSVLQPYKAYNAAMQSQDYATAIKQGKAAWRAAEAALGDNKTTGDLAFNYGFLEKAQGDAKRAVEPLERSTELAATPSIRIEREVELVAVLDGLGEFNDAVERAEAALKYADANELAKSLFAGELMVFEVNECNRRATRAAQKTMSGGRTGSRVNLKKTPELFVERIQSECGKRAEQALSIFDANSNLARPDFVAVAANTVGYAKERTGDWQGAAMAYQSSREAIEDKLGRGHPLVAHTIGRWVNARGRISFDGELEAAKQAGLKDAWPYIQDGPKVQETRRIEADFGTAVINTRRLSGYAILLADVTDSGKVKNIRVLDSAPGDAYVKISKEALEQWEYPSKTAGEPEGFRKDIAVPFNYIVFDRNTQDTY